MLSRPTKLVFICLEVRLCLLTLTGQLRRSSQLYLIHIFRAKLCADRNFLESLNNKTVHGIIGTNFTDDPELLRFGNFVTKTLVMIAVLITALSIYWKKRRLMIKVRKCNVITFNQTILLLALLYLTNAVWDYVLTSYPSPHAFTLEMLRIVLVENIFLKFLLPIILIINTKMTLPSLWTDVTHRRIGFFMTKSSFVPRYRAASQTAAPHQPFSKQKYRQKRISSSLATIAEYDEICETHSGSRSRSQQHALVEVEIH